VLNNERGLHKSCRVPIQQRLFIKSLEPLKHLGLDPQKVTVL